MNFEQFEAAPSLSRVDTCNIRIFYFVVTSIFVVGHLTMLLIFLKIYIKHCNYEQFVFFVTFTAYLQSIIQIWYLRFMLDKNVFKDVFS